MARFRGLDFYPVLADRLRVFRPKTFELGRVELRELMRRSREVVLLAAITGILTGLAVRGFDYVVESLYHRVVHAPLWLTVVTPAAGLVVSALILRYVGNGASSATSDEYLRAYHDHAYRLRPRFVAARTMAAIATLGSGGALGLEGPSLYGGAALGRFIQERLPRPFRGSDHRILLVAGAAAGVAAIFKAPATGAIFALEVPYRDELGRRMLLPALVASASGYLTFVMLSSTTPLLGVGRFTIREFDLRDLAGALIVGVVCAIGARTFARMMKIAKRYTNGPMFPRVAVSAFGLMALVLISRQLTVSQGLTDIPLSIGAGYEVFRDLLLVESDIAIWVLMCLFVIRTLASALTTTGSGVGGLFIPLVVAGGITGLGIGEIVHHNRAQMYTLLGVAAFLGAGYRVPLAAVMFVAETTGKPNFVVPALLAAVAADLVMGSHSITAFQRRPGDVDHHE